MVPFPTDTVLPLLVPDRVLRLSNPLFSEAILPDSKHIIPDRDRDSLFLQELTGGDTLYSPGTGSAFVSHLWIWRSYAESLPPAPVSDTSRDSLHPGSAAYPRYAPSAGQTTPDCSGRYRHPMRYYFLDFSGTQIPSDGLPSQNAPNGAALKKRSPQRSSDWFPQAACERSSRYVPEKESPERTEYTFLSIVSLLP